MTARLLTAPMPTGTATPSYSPLAWHLARRLTGGPTPALLQEITATSPSVWVSQQLNPTLIVDADYQELATRFPEQNTPHWWLRYQYQQGALEGYPIRLATVCGHISRLIWSRRQLEAQIIDFWANHFNVPVLLADEVDATRTPFQAILVRGSLGKFTDLLSACIRHPAMLTYLDNRSSTADQPNENLARELLELHTVGVGQFTEADVRQLARVLSGLSVCRESDRYEYKPWLHAIGPVRVLGWSHANPSRELGYQVAAEFLAYVARHPATARLLCTKLAQRFVALSPPAALIDRMVREYQAKDTAIAPVLSVLFNSPEFAASAGTLVARPMDAIVAAIRLLGHKPDAQGYEGIKQLIFAMGNAGQLPLNHPTPEGYPNDPAVWSSTSNMLQRWNVIRGLCDKYWPATLVRPASLIQQVHPASLPGTHGALVDGLGLHLLGVPLTATERAAALQFIEASPTAALRGDSAAVTWRLPDLVAAILSLPRMAYR